MKESKLGDYEAFKKQLEENIKEAKPEEIERTLFELERYLESGTPCIVQVWTEHLSYWREAWMHDMVVVGIEGDTVLVNDPAFPDAPKAIAKSEFERVGGSGQAAHTNRKDRSICLTLEHQS